MSPSLARAIAFLVGAAIFIGGMALVVVFVAAPLQNWYGDVAHGWPAWAHIAFVVCGVTALYSLGFYLKRRDQRKADRATL